VSRACAPDAAGAQLLPSRQGLGLGNTHSAQREQERRQRCAWLRAAPRNCPDRRLRVGRQALLGGSESLARGTARLEEGQRVLLETENLGNDVLVSLQRQRQQIKGAQCAPRARSGAQPRADAARAVRRDTLEETSGDLGASDTTLRTMYIQSLVNGSMCYLVAAVVVASLLLVLYAKLRSLGLIGKPHSPPPPPPWPSPPPPRLLLARAAAAGVAKPA
jgi:hypothetical protein